MEIFLALFVFRCKEVSTRKKHTHTTQNEMVESQFSNNETEFVCGDIIWI